MVHDFKKFPELTNSQMQFYYWDSPHKQIVEDFTARVVEVTDGDTIKVKSYLRDFEFKIRMARISAPELSEVGGLESKYWLKDMVEGKEVRIGIDRRNRVGKFGRLIGEVISGGENISDASLRDRQSYDFFGGREGQIPSLENTIPDFIGGTFR